jgi:hypothetical protein
MAEGGDGQGQGQGQGGRALGEWEHGACSQQLRAPLCVLCTNWKQLLAQHSVPSVPSCVNILLYYVQMLV